MRGRALRLLLPGGMARDSAAASAAFAIVADALRAGELVACDADVYGRALAMCGPKTRMAVHCCMDWIWYIPMHCGVEGLHVSSALMVRLEALQHIRNGWRPLVLCHWGWHS